MICNLIIASLCLPTYADKTQLLLHSMTQRYIYENSYGKVDIILGSDVFIGDSQYPERPKLVWKECKKVGDDIICSSTFAGNAQGNAVITIQGKTRESVQAQWKLIEYSGGAKTELLEPIE